MHATQHWMLTPLKYQLQTPVTKLKPDENTPLLASGNSISIIFSRLPPGVVRAEDARLLGDMAAVKRQHR